MKAGSAVDDLIAKAIPHLEEGDIIIDAGNSHYIDSIRRCKELESKGFLFVGLGLSDVGDGPSVLPGGSPAAWPEIKKLFQDNSAHIDGVPCCDWVGENGAGHYVKMVQNGIEYGDMQLIAEAYNILKASLASVLLLRFAASDVLAIFIAWS